MKLLLAIAALLLWSIAGKCQELVSIQYTDTKGRAYDCLLVSYDPDDTYMRISFDRDGKNYIIQLEYNTLPTGKFANGQEYVVMVDDSAFNHQDGIVNAFRSPDVLEKFRVPSFIWYPDSKVNPDDDRPYFSYDPVRFTNKKRVDLCELINPEDITNDLLMKFFWEDEDEYKELRKLCRVEGEEYRAIPPLKIKPTMHFVMVVNKDDKKIGLSCSKDQEKLDKEFSAIARTLGIPYKPYFIYCANDLTKTKLKTKLDEINPSPDDIMIFSYSGHGNRWSDQKDVYPFMDLWVTAPFGDEINDQDELNRIKRVVDLQSMSLSEVYNMVIKKKARLNIVLGDLCNASIGVPRPVNVESYLSFGHRDGTNFIIRDTLKLRKLFINARGSLLSTAAKPDETASGNSSSGGYYTTSFVDALREAASFRSEIPSWESIINKTIANALVYRKKADPAEVQNGLRYNKVVEDVGQ
ncbi:MAG: caspase family protein [Chitinophagaceae bacterium]